MSSRLVDDMRPILLDSHALFSEDLLVPDHVLRVDLEVTELFGTQLSAERKDYALLNVLKIKTVCEIPYVLLEARSKRSDVAR